MARAHRRDARYQIRFPAQLTFGRHAWSLLTEDVSLNGVFLATHSPPPALQLVRVRLVLPIGDRALEAHGMTVHIVEPTSTGLAAPRARTSGVGIQFYALDAETRLTWESFIRHVEAKYPPSADQAPLRLVRGMTPEPMRRRFQRHTAVLKMAPPTRSALEDLYTKEISQGMVEIATPLDVPVGAHVVVHVSHPDSATPFLMDGTVLYGKEPPHGSSVTVELAGMKQGLREEFLDFIGGGIIIGEERVEG